MDQLKASLASKNIRLNLSEAVIEHLADKGYDNKMGARPLSRKIDELIRVPLSKKILFERLSNCDIQINLDQDQLVFVSSAHAVTPHVDNDGMIQV